MACQEVKRTDGTSPDIRETLTRGLGSSTWSPGGGIYCTGRDQRTRTILSSMYVHGGTLIHTHRVSVQCVPIETPCLGWSMAYTGQYRALHRRSTSLYMTQPRHLTLCTFGILEHHHTPSGGGAGRGWRQDAADAHAGGLARDARTTSLTTQHRSSSPGAGTALLDMNRAIKSLSNLGD